MRNVIYRIVAWFTAGYPEPAPGPDRVPLFALLRRRLTDDDISRVVRELLRTDEFDDADIGAHIVEITDALPRDDDVERVRARLATNGG